MKRKMLDRNLFTRRVIPQENRYSLMSATIHPDGRFSMHGKLAGKLGGVALGIIFTADAKNFILAEAKDDGDAITFPKNGSKILPSALEIVKKEKLPLPVKYEVWLGEDGIWQGDDMENPTLPLAGKRHGLEKASAACRGNI